MAQQRTTYTVEYTRIAGALRERKSFNRFTTPDAIDEWVMLIERGAMPEVGAYRITQIDANGRRNLVAQS